MTDPAPAYPDDLVADITMMSGANARLRPIRPDDAERLVAFHQRLSPDTVYRRYFYLHPTLSRREVEHFTHVDYDSRLALVVEREDELIAVGRYERLTGTTDAEVAFVVADRYQHDGIGTVLLDRLARAAGNRGIVNFVAETLADNQAMLDVFLHSGYAVTVSREGGTTKVEFPIVRTAERSC